MKVSLIVIGRARAPLAEAVAEYEKRAARYFNFQSVEVKEVAFRGQPTAQLLEEEGERLLARVPVHHELVALHRLGSSWSSEQVAEFLSAAALRSAAGVAFVIGGAYGLSNAVLERATRQWSLGALTLPHELARLITAEQLYRAGTISRGEPYHKASQL